MSIGIKKNLGNAVLLFWIFSFLAVGLFSMSHTSSGMKMNGDGTMSGCLFDGQAKICPMTIAEHLSRWQGMFTAIPKKTDFLVTLFVLISAFGAFLLFNFRRHLLLLLFSRLSDRWRLYLKQNPHLSLFDHLREAFSQGILKSKNLRLGNFVILAGFANFSFGRVAKRYPQVFLCTCGIKMFIL